MEPLPWLSPSHLRHSDHSEDVTSPDSSLTTHIARFSLSCYIIYRVGLVRAISDALIGFFACLLSVCPLPRSSVSLGTLAIVNQVAEAGERLRKMPLPRDPVGLNANMPPTASYLLESLCRTLKHPRCGLTSIADSPLAPSWSLFQEVGEMGTDWVVFICFFFLSSDARVEPGTLLILDKCPTTELCPHGPIL